MRSRTIKTSEKTNSSSMKIRTSFIKKYTYMYSKNNNNKMETSSHKNGNWMERIHLITPIHKLLHSHSPRTRWKNRNPHQEHQTNLPNTAQNH